MFDFFETLLNMITLPFKALIKLFTLFSSGANFIRLFATNFLPDFLVPIVEIIMFTLPLLVIVNIVRKVV